MAASGRSGSSSSSFTSSLGQFNGPADPTLTPNTTVSALTADLSSPQTPPRPLDLGPPGYHATIKLFERTQNETTVYLGPWEIIGSNPRRVVWQCSYEGEVLEHFLPTDNPSNVFPFTFHAHHRRFGDPREMELYLAFQESHRVRYLTPEGLVLDDMVEVKYEFTTIESSIRFQGDLRRKDLIDWFDVDVAWTDVNRRTDTFGNVRGLGAIQRLKLWRDRHSARHFLTLYANHRRHWREFAVQNFELEFGSRDDRHRRIQLNARTGRTDSGTPSQGRHARRFSASSIFRPRRSSVSGSNTSAPNTSAPSPPHSLDIRYLGLQFSQNNRVQPASEDFRRFLERWHSAHTSDGDDGVPYPVNHYELPSPQADSFPAELNLSESLTVLSPVMEPTGTVDRDETP